MGFLLNPPAPALIIELACWVQSCRLFRAILLALGFHFAGLNMILPKERYGLALHCVWVKKGGSSPVSNTALAALFEKANELDIPRDNLDHNIKRASEKDQEAYIEKFYEVYGYGGVGMIISVLTDKVNRLVAAVREVVKDCGGKMADSGSIMFKFKRARVVNIKATESDKDQLVALALDAGADDVIEPSIDEDDTEDDSERYIKIVSSIDNYPVILSKLREEEITFETDNGFELLPSMPIEVDDEAMDLNKELMSKLLELDDVDAVYTNQK